MQWKPYTVMALVLTAILQTACGEATGVDRVAESHIAPPVVEIVAREYSLAMPSEIASGWTTFRLRNEGKQEHSAYINGLPDGLSYERYMEEGDGGFDLIYDAYYRGDLTRTEAIDRMVAELPEFFLAGTVSSGGPALTEPGETSLATVHLEPGTYVVDCYVKMPDGVFHNNMGMHRELTVKEESNGAAPPEADAELVLSNYEISLSRELKVGEQTVAVRVVDTPDGIVMHDINLFRLAEDTDIEEVAAWMDWMDVTQFRAPAPGVSLGGMENMAAGKTGYITVDLEPGNYAWVSEGYADRGMVETFVVR